MLERPTLTTAYTDWEEPVVADGVYPPQEDSQLLIDVMDKTGLARGRRVADLCTGSGVVAIAAAEQGASEVTAFDICPRAVHFARKQAVVADVDIDVHLGSWARATEFGPFDLVVSNPPYVPHDPTSKTSHCRRTSGHRARGTQATTADSFSTRCAHRCGACSPTAARFLLVQSEFAEPRKTLAALAGLRPRRRNPCLAVDSVRSGAVRRGRNGSRTPAGSTRDDGKRNSS